MSDRDNGLEKEQLPHEDKTNKARLSRRKFIGGTIAGLGAMGLSEARAKMQAQTPLRADKARKARKKQPAIPHASKHNGLNIIIIVADTWRADHLGCYGSTRVKTPHLDKLASEGVLFTNAHAEGLPTIPSRRVYHTGKSVLPESKWQPLSENDVTFAEILGKHRVTSGFIVDTYHHFKPGYDFHRGFDSWQWIRGQESDQWKSGPKGAFDPKKHMPEHWWDERYDEWARRYLMNTQDRESEEDYFCAKSCQAAMNWLERNAENKPFMLWIDMFDPHEPWDAPVRFQKMYRDAYPYERCIFGYGINKKNIRADDLPLIKDLYAAEVTFSDYCIGRLLDKVREMKMMDDTIIVFTTDHGTHLGEEGCVQKTAELLNGCVSSIPLIIKHPDNAYASKQVDGLVSAVDFMPTFLALLGIDDISNMDGDNMWKLVTGETPSIHDHVYTVFQQFGAVHNRDWHYFQNIRGRKRGKGPCLYDLKNDTAQTRNVIGEFGHIAKQLRGQLQGHLGIEIPPLKS